MKYSHAYSKKSCQILSSHFLFTWIRRQCWHTGAVMPLNTMETFGCIPFSSSWYATLLGYNNSSAKCYLGHIIHALNFGLSRVFLCLLSGFSLQTFFIVKITSCTLCYRGFDPLIFLKLFATLCVLLLLVLQHLMWNGLHCTPQLSWYFYIESAEDRSCSCAMFYAWCKIMTCFHNFLFSMMLYNISDFGDQISLMIDYIRFCRWKLCCALPQAFMLNF